MSTGINVYAHPIVFANRSGILAPRSICPDRTNDSISTAVPTTTYFSKTACDIWPNITGTYEADYLSWAYDQISKPTSGAFYAYKSSRGLACTGGASVPAGIGFRANSSHSLFGNSSTIQPASYRAFCLIKF